MDFNRINNIIYWLSIYNKRSS